MAAGLIGIIILLLPCAVMDVWKKKVPVIYLAVLLTASVLVNLLTGRVSLWEMIFGILYGVLFLLISVLTKGAVGFGDGVMIGALGAWTGILFTLSASIFGFLFAGLFGLCYIKVKKMDRKTKLPFAPFLTAAALLLSILELITGG